MISHLDHVVLTTSHEQACIHFYVDLLGMKLEVFGEGRKAFRFGNQKINLHVKGAEFEPKAHLPVPGALDLCFISNQPLEQVIHTLMSKNIKIEQGPVKRTGATGPIQSIYLRDPDRNLIEISEYL